MAGKSDYAETAVLNYYFRTATMPTKPTSVYIALHTADPEAAGAEVATTGSGYARVQIAVADAQWSAPSDDGAGRMRITNVNPITFPNPSANWGTITHVAIYDAATGGNMLYNDILGASRTVNAGDVAPSFAAGVLTIAEG